MGMRIKITPKFNVKRIISKTIERDWFEFQAQAFELGNKLLKYIRNYITTGLHRQGSTGNLAMAITLDRIHGAGKIEWGIGNREVLNRQAPYWYVINYGKKITGEPFIPGGGKYRPVKFTDGNADPSLRGTGRARVTKVRRITKGTNTPSSIRPTNYIEATRLKLNIDIKNIIRKLKRRK